MSGSDFLEGQFQKKSFQKFRKNRKNVLIEKIFADSEWAGPIWHKTFEKGEKRNKKFLTKVEPRFSNYN
jgi:hypothetical protein